MKRTRADLVKKIEAARANAETKKQAFKDLTSKRYDYWRAVAAAVAYDNALLRLASATEHTIPGMAAEALADFERVRDSETTEMELAVADGRRDALATVADWMTAEEETA